MENRTRLPSKTAHGRHWTETEARQWLDEWSASGESLGTFARRRGIHPQRLSWWRKRLGMTEAVAPAPLIPVVLEAPRSLPVTAVAALTIAGCMHIELRVLDETSARWVATLSRALGDAS